MDKLSDELVHLIFEVACKADVHGKIARSLCFVSKRFCRVGQSFALRSVSVSGPYKIKQLTARLKELELESVPNIQHLFICDYTKEDALYEDTCFIEDGINSYGASGNFLDTKEGQKIINDYHDARDEFWSLVGYVLNIASPTLRTLSLLSFHAMPISLYFGNIRDERKAVSDNPILAVLSGTNVKFPRLQTLTLRHKLGYDLEEWQNMKLSPIDAPLLEGMQLIIASRFFNSQTKRVLHPLLWAINSRHPVLTKLVFSCFWESYDPEKIIETVCGDPGRDVRENVSDKDAALVSDSIKRHVLPGRLTSAVIQMGRTPLFYCGTGYSDYFDAMSQLIDDVASRYIAGLRVSRPTETFPKEGEREYERLFKQWEERSLGV